MKKYNVTVNGTVYEVEVEEVGGDSSAPAAAPVVNEAPKAAAPAPVPKPAAKPAAPKAAAAAGSVKIEAPMPGVITKVCVKPGDAIKTGDTIVAFEAMKMEQEIKSPKDGTVASINVSQGDSIKQGDILATLN